MLEIVLKDESSWRRSGRPAKPVDATVLAALQSTYRTQKIGSLPISSPEDYSEAMAFVAEARRAARSLGGVRVVWQPQSPVQATNELRFRLVDWTK